MTIDIEKGYISIENDGSGIPIEWHSEQKMYVPEMIFGNLLTSSNYDDTKPRTTGGKNGLGSKIANIFSKEFVVITADQGKIYKQTFQNNMTIVNPPKITKTKSKSNASAGTTITFYPDLQRFGLTEFSDDFVSFLRMRAYEISACTDSSVSVHFNGDKIACKNFEDFVKLFDVKYVYEMLNSRWTIAAAPIKDNTTSSYSQVSFVNGISTSKGGKHVDYIRDQIVKKMIKMIESRKKISVKPKEVKEHLMIFVKAI